MVREHRGRFGLNRCCQALGLSKGSWHRRLHLSARCRDNEVIGKQMRKILKTNPDYGYRRMVPELSERLGRPINHKRVRRLLRENDWAMVRQLPRRKPSAVQRVLQNRSGKLDLVRGREFEVLQVLSTDFTELRYAGGREKAWLMAMHDPESRWVAGWAVGPSRERQLALRCWKRAKKRLKRWKVLPEGMIVHQDQDSVFTSYRWLRQLLIHDGARVSFSENGARHNPWIESLWGRMKTEIGSLIQEAASLDELERVIDRRFDYYNHRRRHSAIGYRPPVEYLKTRIRNGENISSPP